MSLGRELLVDLVGLMIATWIFAFVGWFVFIWYQSYAMIDSSEREQEWPSHWRAKLLAYISFHLSLDATLRMYFSPSVSLETKAHRKRFYLGMLSFFPLVGLGMLLFWLYRLVHGATIG